MELTITRYCELTGASKRYIQRLIKDTKKNHLIHANHGVTKFTKHGNTYVLQFNKERQKQLNALQKQIHV